MLSWSPARVKAPLSASPLPATSANVCAWPTSLSVAASVPTALPAGRFSSTSAGDSATSVGAWFTNSATSVTEIVSAFWNAAPRSSLARTRIE